MTSTEVCTDDHSSGKHCDVHGYDDSVPPPAGFRWHRVLRADGQLYSALVAAPRAKVWVLVTSSEMEGLVGSLHPSRLKALAELESVVRETCQVESWDEPEPGYDPIEWLEEHGWKVELSEQEVPE